MSQLKKFEASYKNLINALPRSLPDGFIDINQNLLRSLNLLEGTELTTAKLTSNFLFHVNEQSDKITLFNDNFIVWVVPCLLHSGSMTYAFIALNKPSSSQFELAFTAKGSYNSSKIVLRVLDYYLNEIKENESILHKLHENS